MSSSASSTAFCRRAPARNALGPQRARRLRGAVASAEASWERRAGACQEDVAVAPQRGEEGIQGVEGCEEPRGADEEARAQLLLVERRPRRLDEC